MLFLKTCKGTIKSRNKDISTSARRVQQHIDETAENVRVQQTAGLKDALHLTKVQTKRYDCMWSRMTWNNILGLLEVFFCQGC